MSRRQVKVSITQAHKDQLNGALEQMKGLKLEIADMELNKVAKMATVQQLGQQINGLIQQFPSLYNVPADASVNIETGEIVGFIDAPDVPAAEVETEEIIPDDKDESENDGGQ